MSDKPITAAPAVPDSMPGHWDSSDGARMAREYVGLYREQLLKGDVSDLALANAQFLKGREDLDLIVYQTAAKERIRWLSVQLAVARGFAAPEVEVEDSDGWLIWSNYHGAWHRRSVDADGTEHASGYTTEIAAAGVFSERKAQAYGKNSEGRDRAVRLRGADAVRKAQAVLRAAHAEATKP